MHAVYLQYCYSGGVYVARFVEEHVVSLLTRCPVVIIEGVRAVGKTSLLSQLHAQGYLACHVSLVDPQHLAAARDNPAAWLQSLPQPVAIDEAQLLPELPLALKGVLDQHSDQLRFLLTGSAAIGRTRLGGADPLARRAVRVRLEPLTESELRGHPRWSVVDALFNAQLSQGAISTRSPWLDWLPLGGLPAYRLHQDPMAALTSNVATDLASILTEHVLPGEKFDQQTAAELADYLLRTPAAEVNLAAAGRAIGADPRSVDRYMDVLARRFITHELPNLKRSAKRSSRSTAKHYPTDVGLSAASLLRSGASITDDAVRGSLLESAVVQQLCAHLTWADKDYWVAHYRDTQSGRNAEVDIVLVGPDGKIVGIEVKAAPKAISRHTSGLRALKTAYPDRWHRGFVLTTGSTSAQLADDIWSLPLEAICDPTWWQEPGSAVVDATSLTVTRGQSTRPQLEQTTAASKSFTRVEFVEVDPPELSLVVAAVHPDEEEAAYMGNPQQFAADVTELLQQVYPQHLQQLTSGSAGPVSLLFLTPKTIAELRQPAGSSKGSTGMGQMVVGLWWLADPGTALETLSLAETVDVRQARVAHPGDVDYTRGLDATACAILDVVRRISQSPNPDVNR